MLDLTNLILLISFFFILPFAILTPSFAKSKPTILLGLSFSNNSNVYVPSPDPTSTILKGFLKRSLIAFNIPSDCFLPAVTAEYMFVFVYAYPPRFFTSLLNCSMLFSIFILFIFESPFQVYIPGALAFYHFRNHFWHLLHIFGPFCLYVFKYFHNLSVFECPVRNSIVSIVLISSRSN